MLVEKIEENLSSRKDTTKKIDYVYFEWYELEKRIQRKTSEHNVEVGIRISHPIKDGDILYEDENSMIVASLLPCELTVVSVHSMKEMGRLCFELGNRHLSLAIEENQVSVIYDEPTFLYLKHIGFEPKKRTAKFENYTVCHAHEHTHHS